MYARVVEACDQHRVVPGVFCLGKERAQQLEAMGFKQVGFDIDLNVLISYASSCVPQLKES